MKLTEREKQCLYWAANDKSIKETAKIMFVSESTVKKHREQILRKIECKTIAGAVGRVVDFL